MTRRVVELDASWEVEYTFGTGWRARFWGWAFDVVMAHTTGQTLVRLGVVRGGARGVADMIAVESLIAATRNPDA